MAIRKIPFGDIPQEKMLEQMLEGNYVIAAGDEEHVKEVWSTDTKEEADELVQLLHPRYSRIDLGYKPD